MANFQNSSESRRRWQPPPVLEWVAAAGRHLTCTSLSKKILEEFERAERKRRIIFDEEHWLALSEEKPDERYWKKRDRGLSY